MIVETDTGRLLVVTANRVSVYVPGDSCGTVIATNTWPVWSVFSERLLAYTQLPLLFVYFANMISDCEDDQALVKDASTPVYAPSVVKAALLATYCTESAKATVTVMVSVAVTVFPV